MTARQHLRPHVLGQFSNHREWVNYASRVLTGYVDSNGAPLSLICVDARGRRCNNGKDMKRACDEGNFPVVFFGGCELVDETPIAAALRALLPEVLAEIELRKATSSKPEHWQNLEQLAANATAALLGSTS